MVSLWLLLGLAALPVTQAQDQRGWEVFIQRNIDAIGTDRLIFIDLFTGEEVPLEVNGERYTLLDSTVMFLDLNQNRILLAQPDGTTLPHPFIQPGSDARRVDWTLSADRRQIAWTVTAGTSDALMTTTSIATLDGSGLRPVFTDGPRNAIRAWPVAFSSDGATLYMDFQPDGIGDFLPYPQYAGLFALNLTSGLWEYLPGEPGCFCGAGFYDNLLLRLRLSADQSGFDLHIINLTGDVSQVIPAQNARGYTQAGDIVFSPDGRRVVYALASISNFNQANQSALSLFMLVNLDTLTQAPLTNPISTFVEPLAWTESNRAIVFTSRQRDGTWKIRLEDGTLDRVADATYLGRLAG